MEEGPFGAFAVEKKNRRLEPKATIERHYVPDEAAVLAALRLVLGLPRHLESGQEELT